MTAEYCVVLCTVPDPATGERLAQRLLEDRLAACANILPGLTSLFRWQGAIQKEAEALLIIKTRRDRFEALCETLRSAHPYELPEIIAVPVSDALAGYLRWIDQSLESPS